MDHFSRAIEALFRFILFLGSVIVGAIITVEYWLREQLTQLHVPRATQSIVLVLFAVVLVIGSLRLFGGLIRLAFVVVLLLITIDIDRADGPALSGGMDVVRHRPAFSGPGQQAAGGTVAGDVEGAGAGHAGKPQLIVAEWDPSVTDSALPL